MQVSIESLEGLQRKLTVQVPSEKIATAIEQKLKQISKTVKMDGFRPGKVPAKVVRQTYGAQIRQEVIGDVIESSYRDALIQEKLRPAGMPEILPINDTEDKDGIAYTATFEVYPEITALELASIEVERPVADISPDDLENMINKLIEQRKEWIEVERASVTGDQVMCDFDGTIDGEAFAGGSSRDAAVEIGGGKMLKEFEEGLTGMSKGEEKTIDVHFPEDYHGKEVAGKTAQFVLSVSKVSEAKIPELNKELIKSFGVEDGNIESFKQDIRQNMEKELAQKVKTSLKNKVMAELLAKNDVLAPKAMVDEEIKNLKAQMAQNMGQDSSKMDMNSFPDDLFQEEAAKRVKLGLLVGELIRIENIQLDQTRLNSALQEMAASYEDPQQVIQYYTQNKDARTNLEGMVLEDQVVDYILDKAKVSEKASSFEELMNNPSK